MPLKGIFWENKKIKHYTGDLLDISFLKQIFKENNIDIVIHLITYYKPKHKLEEINDTIKTNVAGIINLLEIMSLYGVKNIINTGTCFEYSTEVGKIQDEKARLDPWNLYALSKIFAEQSIDFFIKRHPIDAITLRLFPPFGLYDNPNKFIPYVIQKALNNENIEVSLCEQEWDYIFSKDIAKAFRKALEYEPANHEIFNISYNNPISLRKIIEYIVKRTKSQSQVKFGAKSYRQQEIMFLSADNKSARKKLGWMPKYSIYESLDETIDHIRGLSKNEC